MSYVILTSKDGIFRTEAEEGVRPVEAWDYLFYGTRRARFVLAELLQETRVRIVEEQEPASVNLVRSKFLEHFDTVEEARAELASLTHYGRMDTKLQKVG